MSTTQNADMLKLLAELTCSTVKNENNPQENTRLQPYAPPTDAEVHLQPIQRPSKTCIKDQDRKSLSAKGHRTTPTEYCVVCKQTHPQTKFYKQLKVHKDNIEMYRKYFKLDHELQEGSLCNRCYKRYCNKFTNLII